MLAPSLPLQTCPAAAAQRSLLRCACRAATRTGSNPEADEAARRLRASYLVDELTARAAALGSDAVFPDAGDTVLRREADALLSELVSLAPAELAASSETAGLAGTWTLAFATRGTVVTRAATRLPLLDVTGISQKLSRSGAEEAQLAATNEAELCLPGGASFRLSALGSFDVRTQSVSFAEFGVAPSRLFGVALDAPLLRIPVPVSLRRAALFKTVYLDERARVARGQTGNCFFFRRA